jgi:hypothetical protein
MFSDLAVYEECAIAGLFEGKIRFSDLGLICDRRTTSVSSAPERGLVRPLQW